jgi:hypothetical protein
MNQPLGQSFAPMGSADEEIKKPTPAQQAIQVLSMRLPRVRGAKFSPLMGESRSPASSQAGGMSPDSAIFQALMKTLSGGSSMPQGAMPSMSGGMDPMAAAMSALGDGMANAPMPSAPQAPVIVPGIGQPPGIVAAPPPEDAYQHPVGAFMEERQDSAAMNQSVTKGSKRNQGIW